MPLVKKTISLEDFTDRLGSYVPSYENGVLADTTVEGYTAWGKQPFDIIVCSKSGSTVTTNYNSLSSGTTYDYCTLSALTGTIPLVVNTQGNVKDYVLRYKVMSTQYAALLKLMRNATYYRACRRNIDTYKWVEISEDVWNEVFHVYAYIDGKENTEYNADKLFSHNWVFYNELPEDSSAEEYYGDTDKMYICVTEYSDWFVNTFFVDDARYDNVFYYFVKELTHDTNSLTVVSFSEPFCGLNFLIDEDITNIGVYRPYIQEWIPNKRYYLGDKVRYSVNSGDTLGTTYRLSEGSAYEEVTVSRAVYDANHDDYESYYDIRQNGECYFRAYYYKGYYDSNTRITHFDVIDSNGNIIVDASGNTTHWTKCVSSDTPAIEAISGNSISHLDVFGTIRNSYDDANNPLPFILDEQNSNNTLLKYTLGPQQDGDRVDILSAVTFYTDDNETYSPVGSQIKATESILTSGYTYIGFEYYMGATYNGTVYNTEDGIYHNEIYPFKILKTAYQVDDATAPFVWLHLIDYTGSTYTQVTNLPEPTNALYKNVVKYTGYNSTTPNTFDNGKHDYVPAKTDEFYICYPLFTYFVVDYDHTYQYDENSGFTIDWEVTSKISYSGSITGNDSFQNTDIFTADYMMGYSDVTTDININIERGTSSATERHGALSEVNTLQDLEDYKNDMFKIRT